MTSLMMMGAVFGAALADPSLPGEQRAPPRVGITIDAATVAGLADNPGHLDGYGPIPPAMARRIAGEGWVTVSERRSIMRG